MNSPITIVLADDCDYYRDSFEFLLGKYDELKVVASAANGRDLIDKVRHHLPDIVFIDIKMPVMDGIEACRVLHDQYPEIGKIAITMYEEKFLMREMLKAGARGFLLKNTQKAGIVQCIKTVHSGGVLYYDGCSPFIMSRLLDTKEEELTDLELQVVRLLCKEYTTEQIAAELCKSEGTINAVRQKLYEKSRATNPFGLALFAVRNGLIKL